MPATRLRPAGRDAAKAPAPSAPASPPPSRDLSPSRYISRVSLLTGKEIRRPVEPEELLVHAHRDHHPVQVAVQFLAGQVIRLTEREEHVRRGLRLVNSLGARLAGVVGSLTGSPSAAGRLKRLIGVTERDVVFRFRETTRLGEASVRERVQKLKRDARAALLARGRRPRLQVLITGATGFLGKEILFQAAQDPRIELVVALVRPETVRDPKTKEVVKVLTPQERGALLMKRLHIPPSKARKYRFVSGDIEKPNLGLPAAEVLRLSKTLTHVVHCAASVSFDDTYENSFRANVLGCLNALNFSLAVQETPGACFVEHVTIETSYIHGRKKASIAQEQALVFPGHFYNNYYELTKAMASIETDRAMIERGLRVTQLLPSIVIGHSRTGNNRGDTKVVNAPINAFGRAKEATETAGDDLRGRFRAFMIAALANGFPGDPSAELNLVPVDRVAAGILAALTVPEAIGTRIHLATDNRIRSEDMIRITREELGVKVRLSDPILYRNVTLPLVKATLQRMNEPKLAGALEKLGTLFGGYGEWGQPIHEVGNDVRILGLPLQRPATQHAFRMLCRHNRYVQEFGKVRDLDEIARRERVWEGAIAALEFQTGREAAAIGPDEFRKLLAEKIDLKTFRKR